MLRQTRQPMSVFQIPINQSKQLWHHSTPEYIWHHLPKITKTWQTGYTNHDRHKIKIEHDIIDKPVKVNEIPQQFIHEIKTKGYDVIGVNLFPPTLMRFPPKKGVNSVRPILLTFRPITTQTNTRSQQYVYLKIRHSNEVQLTAVKLLHPLTIITWLYRGLRYRPT